MTPSGPHPTTIRAATHPIARQLRMLGRGLRERREEGLFLAEGPRALEEALAAGADVAWIATAAAEAPRSRPAADHPAQGTVGGAAVNEGPRGSAAAAAVGDGQRSPAVGAALNGDPPGAAAIVEAALETAARRGIPIHRVEAALLERLMDAQSGGRVVAACRLPAAADDPLSLLGAQPAEGLLLATWGVQNPGNLGTLVRSAAAFAAVGVLAVGGADPWNPKAVRSSAGGIHRLPVVRAADDGAVLARIAACGRQLVAAAPRGGVPPEALDWTRPTLLLLGAEVAGLPPAVAGPARLVTIPMARGVESLSVATAGTILLERAHAGRERGAAPP